VLLGRRGVRVIPDPGLPHMIVTVPGGVGGSEALTGRAQPSAGGVAAI
jgi:hypothetical protein